MKVSIILVHYKEKKVLYDCIRSIYENPPKTPYEIIVVDNDEIKNVGGYLKKNFPKVNYVESPGNIGYGKGNNLGVEQAKGEYVFILNPDTVVTKGAIDKLLSFISTKKKVGVVAPTLYDEKGNSYPLQGTQKLTPLRGIFALSFLNKIFPNSSISKNYWLKEADRTKPLEVDVVPGSAFLVKKSLFEKLGGFDKNFFLYFEEADFCNRVKDAGYKLFILPESRILHYWAVSTPPSPRITKIFTESRFYYFKKNFGLLNAFLVEAFTRLDKWHLILLAILALGTFLRFYKIEENMIFNGEMGYDYTTIRNFVEKGEIPLIGPRTSHEWFHIGPFFYWIFGILLPIFNYSVATGAYFFALVGIASILVCYWVIKNLFGQKAGIISSFLVSFSPLWVMLAHDARFNAMTAVLFFIFYYFLVKSIRDKGKSLFVLGLTLGIMFSFFPSPILLLPGAILTLFIYRKKIEKKYILTGFLGLIIPNIPYLIYNATHKFEIILNLLVWVPYRILGFFGLYPKNTVSTDVVKSNLTGLYTFFQTSYLYKDNILIFTLFLGVLVFALVSVKKNLPLKVLLILFGVSYLGLFLHGAPPQHYYLVIFPLPIILLSLFLEKISKRYFLVAFLILASLLICNLKYYFSKNWFYVDSEKISIDYYYVPFKLQERVANYIVRDVGPRSFSLGRVGPYDRFEEDFSLNYHYLLRILGKKPESSAKLKYTIYEDTSKLPEGGNVIWIENLAIIKEENE